MFNWLFDILRSIHTLLYKADRSTQLIIAILAGSIAIYNGVAIFSDTFDPAGAVATGAIAMTAAYITIVSLVYYSRDTARRHKEEIMAREQAVHKYKQAKDAHDTHLK